MTMARWQFPLLLTILFAANGRAEERAERFRLAVKYHHQEHRLSCEAAALQMAFDYYHLGVSEADIIKKTPVDPTPHANGVWGDPDQAFVGNVDGEMGETGYGIHAAGLALVAGNWKKTKVIEQGKPADLAAEVQAHHPVLIWGYYKGRHPLTWKTPTGKKIDALDDEHARVVYGFRGPVDAPTGFFVMDPEVGPLTWTTAQLVENWDSLGRTALVVYDEAPDGGKK